MERIRIVNRSRAVSAVALRRFVVDLQTQVTHDFAPAWGVDAHIDVSGVGWPVRLEDMPAANDPPDALGYHDCDSNGFPQAVVFVGLAQRDGVSWTSVVSHEVLEMLADPLVYSNCFIDTSPLADGTAGFIVPVEACDAVEGVTYQCGISRSLVSDFVFPQWFVPGFQGRVDHQARCAGPLTLAEGGYASLLQVNSIGGWQQATAELVDVFKTYRQVAPPVVQRASERLQQRSGQGAR